ncbi:MAG: hypothetical protein V4548_02545 [Bacteroidota bacterium]
MKNTEIEKYFVDNADNESICGIYKFNQVENENNIKYPNLRNRFNRIKVKPIKIVALFSLSFLFTFSSCIMGKRAKEMPEELIENDTINKKEIKDTIEKKNDSIKTEQNLIKKKK